MFKLLLTRQSSTLSPLFQAALADTLPKTIHKGTAGPGRAIPIFSTGNMKVSPQKLNHLARLIHNMTLDNAQVQMRNVMMKRGVNVASLIQRVKSALKHNYGVDYQGFRISECWVGKGIYRHTLRVHGR